MKLKNYIINAFFVILSTLPSSYAANGPGDRGPIGVGFMVGSPIGVTGKYWLDQRSAFDVGVGWGFDNEDVTLYADYLWHDFSAFTFQSSSGLSGGKMPLYLGLGPRIQTDGDDHFGIRGVLGMSYLFPRNPFELFAEVAPVLVLVDDVEGDFDGGIGFRYYF